MLQILCMNTTIITIVFYLLAILVLLISTAAIYLPLIEKVPVKWQYYHYFIRKPIVWMIFVGSTVLDIWITVQNDEFMTSTITPLVLMGIAIVLTYKMHQDNAFHAVDYPTMAEDISQLPLTNDMQLGVIEYGGVTKAYPLDYVIHHHVINDLFGKYIVSLTYCAMCRSIIPFDVTDIGPLFVASFTFPSNV